MGTGPSALETLEAHGQGEKRELGSQRTRAGRFPRCACPVEPEYRLDHAAWQRLSRPASGRDAGGAAHAGRSPGERDASFDTAGDRHYAKPGWADGNQHRAGRSGYVVRAELQSGVRVGTTSVGSLPAALIP